MTEGWKGGPPAPDNMNSTSCRLMVCWPISLIACILILCWPCEMMWGNFVSCFFGLDHVAGKYTEKQIITQAAVYSGRTGWVPSGETIWTSAHVGVGPGIWCEGVLLLRARPRGCKYTNTNYNSGVAVFYGSLFVLFFYSFVVVGMWD